MTGTTCMARRGQSAMSALGALDADEQAELEVHLATCEECRAISTELRATVGALDTWAERSRPAEAASVPPHLTDAVLSGLRTEDELDRRRRKVRHVGVACASAAALVLAVVLSLALVDRPGVPTRTVALSGAPGVTASVVLEQRSWGTSLTVKEQGLRPGQTYTVSMSNTEGYWWTAGSYRASSNAPVVATMGCAARYASIDEIRVTDPGGRTVLVNHPGAAY